MSLPMALSSKPAYAFPLHQRLNVAAVITKWVVDDHHTTIDQIAQLFACLDDNYLCNGKKTI